jgi:dissimilatory sulfite reductase (desulfoviridin) alpha/beta subunit
MKKIYVRYCGGCNPEYDRVAAVQKLAWALNAGITTQPDDAYLRFAVSGCPRRCASKETEGALEICCMEQLGEYMAEKQK